MRIEVVENHRIKVSLTTNDLMYYNLNPETLSPESPELNKFLFQIMEDVKKQTGFNPYCGQVVVEAVRSNSGITLYITKVGINTAVQGAVSPSKRKIKAVAVKSKKPSYSNIRYMFSRFDTLCNALTNMSAKALSLSSLYTYENKWYFVLGDADGFEWMHCILCEYCDKFGGDLYTEAFLQEHGKCVAAGERLISMTDGIKELNKSEI